MQIYSTITQGFNLGLNHAVWFLLDPSRAASPGTHRYYLDMRSCSMAAMLPFLVSYSFKEFTTKKIPYRKKNGIVEVPYKKLSAGNNSLWRLEFPPDCGTGLLISLFLFFPMQMKRERTCVRTEPVTLSGQCSAVSAPPPRREQGEV